MILLAFLLCAALGAVAGAYTMRRHLETGTPEARVRANHRDAVALARDLIRTPDALITPNDLRGRANKIITRFEEIVGVADDTL